MDRYRQGLFQAELAAEFGIHRWTVSKILGRHSALRTPGLSDDQIDEAVRRYELGESLATIGTALGVQARTVRARLIERGMVMRSTRGAR